MVHYQLHAHVFDWKGRRHAYLERIAPTPDRKIAHRSRLLSVSREQAGPMTEEEALGLLVDLLEEAYLRHNMPWPPGRSASPWGS